MLRQSETKRLAIVKGSCCSALVFAVLVGLASRASAAPPAPAPIIFLPGIIGSELVLAQNHNERVWGNSVAIKKHFLELAWPIGEQEDTRFFPSRALRNFISPRWGLGTGAAAYSPFIEFLGGYNTPNRRLAFEFPYDWRYGNLTTACKLKFALDNSGAVFGDPGLGSRAKETGVILVGHSMGGIVANLFAHSYVPPGAADLPANRCQHAYKVPLVVAVGTPHFGSGTVLNWFAHSPGGELISEIRNLGITEEQLRRVIYSIPSFYELAPSYQGCCVTGHVPPQGNVDEPLSIATWEKLDWLPAEVKRDPQWRAFAKTNIENAKLIREIISSPFPGNLSGNAQDRIRVMQIVGQGTPTIQQLATDLQAVPPHKVTKTTDGDGEVPRISAEFKTGVPEEFHSKSARSNHLGLMKDSRIKDLVGLAVENVFKPWELFQSRVKDALGLPSVQVMTRGGLVGAQQMNLDVLSTSIAPSSFVQVIFTVEGEVQQNDGTATLARISTIDPKKIVVDIESEEGTKLLCSDCVSTVPNGSYSVVFEAPSAPGALSLTVTLPGEGMNRSALFQVSGP